LTTANVASIAKTMLNTIRFFIVDSSFKLTQDPRITIGR
jgi:hypothetical protein